MNTKTHSLLDLTVAGRVLEACSGFRDAGASAALWETVAPDLLGQPIADIAEYASAQRDAGGADADAWGGVASALARSSRTTSSPRGSTARGLHEVVEVIGDVTAVVATARAVAAPIAALVRRALDRRRQLAQSGDVQIEVDLPPAASPVGLGSGVAMIVAPEAQLWATPRRLQGQLYETSYGWSDDGYLLRRCRRASGEVVYHHIDSALVPDDWQPWHDDAPVVDEDDWIQFVYQADPRR